MKDLLQLRDEIDTLDAKLVALYEERMSLAEQVAEYKILSNKQVFDKTREIEKLDKVGQLAHTDFNRHGVKELFEQIMAMSRKRQYQMLTEHGIIEKTAFTEIDQLPLESKKIVFQGVEGAYSQQAMQQFFGKDVDSTHVDTWKDAMEWIVQGKADYAVLPIENSSAGIVIENYDLLMEYDVCIVGEQILKIDHCLLGLPEAEFTDIDQVYSHPQALMQCSEFFDKNRNIDSISVKNTAVAAKKVKEDQKMNQAAIASSLTAQLYGLKILDSQIADNELNSTRFIIVSGKKMFCKEAKKISICFEISHESGSLYHTLSHFIYNDLNMNKIESRPIKDKNWEYRFFVDFEGNLNDSAVINAIKGLKEETKKLKILGNYS